MPLRLAVVLAALSVPFAAILGVALVVTIAVPGVTLVVERLSYSIGDTVQFTLRNGLHDPVFMTCSAPWHIYRDVGRGNWQPVEQHACLGIIVELPSGATRTWSWVAVTQSGQAGLVSVDRGQYRIDVSVVAGCDPSVGNACKGIQTSAYFRLS
jgi:hypothetical protein